MGLTSVRHHRRLMALLLPWCTSAHVPTQLQALQLLSVIIVNTWPRIGAHAGVIQGALHLAAVDKNDCSADFLQSDGGQQAQQVLEQIAYAQNLLQACT